MRLALTSDLHVDHQPEVVPLIAARVRALAEEGGPLDAFIVAGDLTANDELLARTLEGLAAGTRDAARHALFVPGNHDLWCKKGAAVDSRRRYEEVVPRIAGDAGFTALGRAPLRTAAGAFAGVTGWYDYTLRDRQHDHVFTDEDYQKGRWGFLRWNDKLAIDWPGAEGPLDDPAICAEQVASLDAQLAALSPADGPVVVVTHHLAFQELTTSKGIAQWDFLNGFMGSAHLGEVIERAAARLDVRAALAGHTHYRKSARRGPLRLEVSPVGYPREYKRMGFDLPGRVADRVILVEV